MAYVIFGVCAVLCVFVVIFAWKVWKENREMTSQKMKEEEDELPY
jgi:hypothetical protein